MDAKSSINNSEPTEGISSLVQVHIDWDHIFKLIGENRMGPPMTHEERCGFYRDITQPFKYIGPTKENNAESK